MLTSLSGVILITLVCFGLGDGARKADPALDGTWQIKSAELAGKKFPAQAGGTPMKLTLKQGTYEFQAESPDRGTVTYHDSAKPKQMDIKGVEGPNAGKTFLAIYELSGDDLKVCYDLSGKSYPTEFKTMPNTQLFLVTYQRIKPEGGKGR
jgi:uncharacterized protein (TIGR03067 family)